MGTKFALIIAVERYADIRWSPVQFAEADATELSAALAEIGIPAGNQQILLNNDATKARIDSRLRRAIDDLQEDDELIIYYAGHGFSGGSRNYLTCHDSEPNDLARTSMALQDIFDFIRSSKSKKIILFLDSCHSEPVSREEDRGLLHDMTHAELREFFRRSEYFVCFSSCKTTEKSYPSRKHHHGIWTYHLLEALTGHAPEAMERDGLVTATSLQNFLAAQVPLTLREVRTDLVTQTPTFYGSMTQEFLIADIEDLLAKRRATKMAGVPNLKRVLFRAQKTLRVKTLSGFKKTHHVPKEVNSYTENFVAKISRTELEEEYNKSFNILRKELGYKRTQLKAQIADGSALIHTPDFSLQLTLSLDNENPSYVILHTEIINLTNATLVLSDDFNRAFDGAFSVIEFEYDPPFDIEGLIDTLEPKKDKRIDLDYPGDASYCHVAIEGMPFSVLVTPGTVRLEFQSAGSPRQLLKGLEDANRFLLSEHEIFLLPAPETRGS